MKKAEINILVVDDDASMRSSLSEAVKRFGYKVTAVGKSDEALNVVKIKHYNAAIIDCMLPKMNGVDLSKEIRKTRFGSAPIVLMSGVFRDKNFATEAMEKTNAVSFLNKPFDLNALKDLLDQNLKDLLSSENVPLQVLVSKTFTSSRERLKVIEGLEEVKGFDLPFILCVIMEANASGHLNVVSDNGELYGITIGQGKIVNVDSSESDANLTRLLLEKGFVTGEDLNQIRAQGRRGDVVSQLVEQHMVSPHILPLVRNEQIVSELKRLFVNEPIRINFVPDRSRKESDLGIDVEFLTPLLHDVVDHVMTADYLTSFYRDWNEYPVQVGPTFSADHPLFKSPVCARVPRMAEFLDKHLTVEEICSQGGFPRDLFFKALHLLAFRRLIIFDEVKKARGVAEYGDRMKALLRDLQGKNPFQVFSYFGCGDDAKTMEVDRIYREFARANHPDLLPPATASELRATVNQVFSIVSEAHNVLMSPDKRDKLVNGLRQKEAEGQIRAEGLAEEAVILLKRNMAKEAYEKTKEAIGLYGSRNVKIAHAWALLKLGDEPEKAAEASRVLDTIAFEERRIPQYVFVSGLLKKSLGDLQGAAAQFDRALAMEPNFIEARREKSILSSGKQQKLDLFNADLTQLVGNFFKKRN